jgi:hypothetical protein
MINLFKSESPKKVEVAVSPAPVVSKTMNQVIEEIHETFYTEVDRLLASAKIANSTETDKQALIDKCLQLQSLGFSNTKEVKEAEIEIKRLTDLKAENEKKESLIQAINHFQFKYPHYKFITEESVKKICAKYNLVYGDVKNYIGTVPDKNLKQIADFKIKKEDSCFALCYFNFNYEKRIMRHVSHSEASLRSQKYGEAGYINVPVLEYRDFTEECPLEIAAPVKDFNMNDMEVKDFKISKIEIPDPVVLKPVFFGGQKHYLIVTAWGLEASDELVVNPINN